MKKKQKKDKKDLNKYRIKKIEQINEEIEKVELKKHEIRTKIRELYCEYGDHKYDFFYYDMTPEMKRHRQWNVIYGDKYEIYDDIIVYRCEFCGSITKRIIDKKDSEEISQLSFESNLTDKKSKRKQEQQEIYNLFSELEYYYEYLIFLKEEICEIFGHDVDLSEKVMTDCKYCGKLITRSDYDRKGAYLLYSGEYDPVYHISLKSDSRKSITNIKKKIHDLPTFDKYMNKKIAESNHQRAKEDKRMMILHEYKEQKARDGNIIMLMKRLPKYYNGQ